MQLNTFFIYLQLVVGGIILFTIIGYSPVANAECDPNCNVNFGGEDCLNCQSNYSNNNSGSGLLFGLVPITLFVGLFAVFMIFGGDSNTIIKIFSGVGGKQKGGVLPVTMFLGRDQPKEEDDWLGVGDFKNGI